MSDFFQRVTNAFDENHWRLTLGVKSVLRVLDDAEHLFTAQEIKNILKKQKQNLDMATIYRILEKLLMTGLVHEFDGKWKKCSDPDNPDEHHFLICERCGRGEELFLDYKKGISEQLAKEKNFLLREVHLAFLGICSHCHSKK